MKYLLPCLLAITTLSAQFPSNERCWEVGGDFLYWKPCAPTYDYGSTQSFVQDSAPLDLFGVKAGYDPGFRIYARTDTHDCCHCWWASWTRFESSDRDQKGPGVFILPSLGLPFEGTFGATLRHCYNKAELRAGRYVSCHCNCRYYAFGSVGYLDIERKQQSTAVNTVETPFTITERQKATFEGGFVQIGAGAEIEEPCNFRLLGHFAAVAGIGKRKLTANLDLDFSGSFDSSPLSFANQTTCIPGLELRVAVEWRYHCPCVWLGVELGYQLDHYFDALRIGEIDGTSSVLRSSSSLSDIGFGGPFLGVKARF